MNRLLALVLVLLTSTPAWAASPGSSVPFASFWGGFVDFWAKWFHNRNSVLFTVLVVGAVAIFIITRGKKLK